MATGTGGSLEEIAQKIMAGQPGTLTAAGSAFKAAYDALNKVATDIPSKVSGVTGTAGQWTGEGADAFVSYAGRMASEIAANASPLSGYQGALSGAASALTTAQGEIQAYLKQAAAYRAQGGTDEAGLAAQAQTILDKLAAAYQQAVFKRAGTSPCGGDPRHASGTGQGRRGDRPAHPLRPPP